MREFLFILSFMVGIAIVSGGIIYMAEKDKEICDTIVVMKDDRIYKCAEISNHDGLTRIIGCDGNEIQVPTTDIRTIEKTEFR